MMRRIRSFFLLTLLSAPLLVAQSEQDIEKRIEGLMSLVRGLQFEQAVTEASQLVADHPHSYEAQMAAFQTNFGAFRYRPDAPNSAQYLETALRRLNFSRRVAPHSYEAWELSLSFWNPARLDPRPKNPEAEGFLSQAEDFLVGGEPEKAIEALKQVINLEATYAPAYAHLGELYFGAREYDEALRFSKAAAERDPNDPVGFLLVARSYAMMGEGEEAMGNLILSLKADPGYPPTWQLITQLDIGGAGVEHMALHFPKPVLWVIDQEIEEPTDEDLQQISEVTRPSWKAYINTKVRWRKFTFQRRNPQFKVYRYTFREELTAITDMLVIWKETRASNPEAEDLLLDQWLEASQAGALDAAVFVDLFMEQFRHDFTMWKLENPDKFEEYFYKFLLPRASSRGSRPAG
jgi:tetratricopeptide (TPR) repeat protein